MNQASNSRVADYYAVLDVAANVGFGIGSRRSEFQPEVLPNNWAAREGMISLGSNFLRNDFKSSINGR
jgi:hypothetical protein